MIISFLLSLFLEYEASLFLMILYGFLMQLVLLNVSKNKLKSLPESVGSCFSLEELHADGMFNSFSVILSMDAEFIW